MVNIIDSEIIEFLQSFRSQPLDFFFSFATNFGSEYFYLFLIPIIYWCFKKEFGLKFSVLMFSTFYINIFLKNSFQFPRPDKKLWLIKAEGYSFPSGHAQCATTFWSYAVIHQKKFLFLSITLIFLISLSRIYLGVHYPIDVIFGILIGISIAVIFFYIEKRFVFRLSENKKIILSITIPFFFAILQQEGINLCSMLIGFLIGYFFEQKYKFFNDIKDRKRRMKRCIVGFGILIPIFLVSFSIPNFLIFFLIGIATSFIIPFSFSLLGLS
ncbi:MAG: phosphatase PAP2 family protein [Candidatus Thermoplasmatota archaeon]